MSVAPAHVKKEIDELIASWVKAINAQDMDAVMALWDDDCYYFIAGQPLMVGKAAIRAFYTGVAKQMAAAGGANPQWDNLYLCDPNTHHDPHMVTFIDKMINKLGSATITSQQHGVIVKHTSTHHAQHAAGSQWRFKYCTLADTQGAAPAGLEAAVNGQQNAQPSTTTQPSTSVSK